MSLRAGLAHRLPAVCLALLLLCHAPVRADSPSTTYKKCLSELTSAKGEERATLLSRLAFLAHYHLKDYRAAESHYQQAIREAREPCRLRLDLASLYVNRLADRDKAIAELTSVVAKGCQPEAVQEAWSLLGSVYSGKDEHRKAIDAYGKAISSGPSGIVDLLQPEDEEEQKIKKTLTWTAPTGGAVRYVIRYSRKEFKTWKEFQGAASYRQELKPAVPGRKETLVLTGVPAGNYWFSIASVDTEGRCSEISNSVEMTLLPESAAPTLGDDELEIGELEEEELHLDEPPNADLAAECLMRIAEVYDSRLEDYSGAITAYKKFLGSRFLSGLEAGVGRAMSGYAQGRIKWLEGEVKRREDTGWHKKPEKTVISVRLDNAYYLPHENQAQVRIRLRSPHELSGLSASMSLENTNTGEVLREVPLPKALSHTVFREVDISGLPVPELPTRKYCFRVRLLKGEQAVGTGRSVIFGRMKAPPRENAPIRELGIDRYGSLLINGRPFIPLGYSGGPFKFPHKVREAGFNWAMQHEGVDFYTFKSTGGSFIPGKGGFTKFDDYTAAKSLLGIQGADFEGEGVLSITTQDEPNGLIQHGRTSEHYFREYTSLTNLFIPNNLVEINLSDSARLNTFETFARIGDYIFCEPWIAPGGCANLTSLVLAAARQSTKPVIPGMILMYPTWGGGLIALRARYYCGLINGARAFGNFSANATFQHWDAYWKLFPEMWPELFSLHRGVHEEIRLLTPVWAAPPVEQTYSVKEEPQVGLEHILRRHEGHYYLFVASPSWKKTTAKFEFEMELSGQKAEMLFEDRDVQIESQTFSDSFSTCDVHVYRFR